MDQIGRWALDQIGRWGPRSDREVGPSIRLGGGALDQLGILDPVGVEP